MPIYDDAMASVGGPSLGTEAPSAPGTEAATDPAYVPPALPTGLDEATPFGSTTASTKPGSSSTVGSGMQPLHGGSRENPAGTGASTGGGLGGKIAQLAISFQGTPYKWGGTTPSGFDCSGFVQYVFAKMGINLPRVSFQQARAGSRVGIGSLRAGDLVAWDNSSRNNGADHIAIAIGGGYIAEAPRPGVPLRIRRLGPNEGAWGVRVL